MTAVNQKLSRISQRSKTRRETYLAAAREVFLEKGFSAASVEDIHARVGGSKATLYSMFGNKQGLFEAMISEMLGESYQSLGIPEVADADLEGTLVSIGVRFVEQFLAPQRLALQRAVIAESVRFPHVAEHFYASGPQGGLRALEHYFQLQRDEGRMIFEDARPLAMYFMDIIKGRIQARALLGLLPRPSAEEIQAYVTGAVKVFLHGCAAPQ